MSPKLLDRTAARTEAKRARTGRRGRVDYDELEQLLVYGERVESEDGGTKIRYPSFRELGKRYGVNHSVIAKFSRRENCILRRDALRKEIMAQAKKKIVARRSEAIALNKQDELRIIDTYLAGFEKALAEGTVRFDSPADYNTMSRLKQFIQGGPDARHEVRAELSLESIQERHRATLRARGGASAAERGELVSASSPRRLAARPPASHFEAATGEVPGHQVVIAMDGGVETGDPGGRSPARAGERSPGVRPSDRAPARGAEPQVRESARHSAAQAPTWPDSGEADNLWHEPGEDER